MLKAQVDYLNDKYPGHAWEAYSEVFGAPNTLHVTMRFADLTDCEAVMVKMGADEAWQALYAKGVDCIDQGSRHDTLMRLI